MLHMITVFDKVTGEILGFEAAGKESVDTFAENSAIKVAYDSSVMNAMLDKLGIFTIEDYKDHEKTEKYH